MVQYKFSVDWFSWHTQDWSRYLDKFKGQTNLQFLEIGSFEGRSTVWLLENILTDKTSKIVCIDTFEGSVEHHQNQEWKNLLPTLYDTFCHNISAFSEQVDIRRGKSQEILRGLNNAYDFIYIDGDHSAAAVLEDAILSFRLLKSGGILIFDDYVWGVDPREPNRLNLEIPRNAIDVFLTIYSNKIRILSVNDQVIIEKL
jgi:predicted O-methyltransferase YrrM